MNDKVKRRLEKIRTQAKRDARKLTLEIPKNIKCSKRDKLVSDCWIAKDGKKYVLSGASRVLLFIIATKGRLAHSKELVKNLNRHGWEKYTGNVYETFFFYEREKMLGVKAELIIEKGKDVDTYKINLHDVNVLEGER